VTDIPKDFKMVNLGERCWEIRHVNSLRDSRSFLPRVGSTGHKDSLISRVMRRIIKGTGDKRRN
jgi:hypothetical protein